MAKDKKEREKLIELIKVMECHPEKTCPEDRTTCKECQNSEGGGLCNVFARKADYLLRNNIKVLPDLKYKQELYVIYEGKIKPLEVSSFMVRPEFDNLVQIHLRKNGFNWSCTMDNIGKTVFYTREEAEQALVNYKSSKNGEQRKEG